MLRFTKSERAYWLEDDQSGERMRIGSLLHYSISDQFIGDSLDSVLARYERLRAGRDAALRDLAAKTKEVVDLRAQIADARRERTSVTSQVRAVDEEPKAAPAVVKADAWPLLHGVFERLQAAENSARKGDTTSALLRVISAVRDLACVEQVPGGGK